MTYGFDDVSDEEQKAFGLVERALRRVGVTHIELEYSEGVEITGPSGSARKVSLHAVVKALEAG